MNTTLHLPFGMELSHNNSIYIVLFQNFHCFFVHASLSMIFVHASLSLDLLGVNTRPDLLWITALFTVPFSFALPCYLIHVGNWTEWSAIWTEIKRVITKFVITSLTRFQSKLARYEVQFPLYYIHFEILNIFASRKCFCLQKTHLRYSPHSNNKRTRCFAYNTLKILQKC